jgi:hypothetical protein
MRILPHAMRRLLPGQRGSFLGSRTHFGGHMPFVQMRRGGKKVHQLRPMPRPALRIVPSHAGPQQFRRGTPALTQRKGSQAEGSGRASLIAAGAGCRYFRHILFIRAANIKFANIVTNDFF